MEQVYLVTNVNENMHYVALSYCWGTRPQYCLTTENLTLLTNSGIDARTLPQTIRDLIFLSRYLGIEYVWVDALCIMQDDQTDWEGQSAIMGDIYENAELTICASSASSVYDGFLAPRAPVAVYCGSVSEAEGSVERCSLYLGQSIFSWLLLRQVLESEPLHSRGWALQERLLSRRKIFFAQRQIIFQCRRAMLSEFGKSIKNDLMDAVMDEREPKSPIHEDWKAHGAWKGLVENYSACGLTRLSDRLPALSGLAEDHAKTASCSQMYIAGHWLASLPLSLLWDTVSGGSRDGLFHAPSWSWASVRGEVKFDRFAPGDLYKTLARIVDYGAELQGTNTYGGVSKAWLDISVPILKTRLFEHEMDHGYIDTEDWHADVQRGTDRRARLADKTLAHSFRGRLDDKSMLPQLLDSDVFLVPILSHSHNDRSSNELVRGLVTVPEGSPDSFRRVGYFYFLPAPMISEKGEGKVRLI